MDFDEYRREGKRMVDYIADYLQNIRSRRVFPDVSPGYMRQLVPDSAPEKGEQWSTIFTDIERVVMPGVTHWQSPHMHAYFPALNSFPSLLGDMLADAIGCLGFTWASSPACTELEIIVMDWLAKMIGLPTEFFHSNKETMGGGVIQTTASEATFVALLAARSEAIKRYRAMDPDLDDAEINARLVGYCSDQAHSSVEKAGLIGLVKMRLLTSDDQLSLRGKTLRDAIEKDKQLGLIPFYLCATLGTTGACAFDNLSELGPICEAEGIWMHIDAAYAGTAFVCPEYRVFMTGIEYAQSFAFNPSKWMMVHFDCTAMWVKDSRALHRTFNVQPLYLRHENTGTAIDYMGVRLASKFEELVAADNRFEVAAKRHLGMVVFRLRGDNGLTEMLLRRLNSSGAVHMVPASLQGRYVIRFTVTSHNTRDADIERDWSTISAAASNLLAAVSPEPTAAGEVAIADDIETAAAEELDIDDNNKVHEAEENEALTNLLPNVPEAEEAAIQRKRNRLRRRGDDFGLSLLLSNVPMSPKFINGSFAALFDNVDVIAEYARHISQSDVNLNGSKMPMSPRRRPYLGVTKSRQYSLDQGFHLFQQKQQQQQLAVGAGGPRLKPNDAVGRSHGSGGGLQRSYGGCLTAGRQGSLDSKIEEIFQTPLRLSEERARQIDRGELYETAEVEDDDEELIDDSKTMDTTPAKNENADTVQASTIAIHDDVQRLEIKDKVNGMRSSSATMMCKWCGHAIVVDGDN